MKFSATASSLLAAGMVGTALAVAVPSAELEGRCNHLHATFNFDGPPRYPVLDFPGFEIVTPQPGGPKPYDSFAVHSSPSAAYNDPQQVACPPQNNPQHRSAITVPPGANYTFDVHSLYIAGGGNNFVILFGDSNPPFFLFNFKNGIVNLEGNKDFEGIRNFAVVYQENGCDQPYIIDDVEVEIDC
ncbi:MAG: hypothetical protein M1824_003519 [Vezdaea acicularis]|nr:MAG: hypothetical protein M1824_003519 [Vezdaea acicularis]